MTMIYIGFSAPKEWKIGAEGIKLWQCRPYSHTYIRFESSKVPSNVYHAAHGMVHFREYNRFKEENKVIKEYKIEVTEEIRLKILIHCMYLSGENYATKELLKIFWADIVYATLKKELDMTDSKGYICSELVGKICHDEFGIEFCKPLFLLKPSDIDCALAKKGYEVCQ